MSSYLVRAGLVLLIATGLPIPVMAVTRHYYIAAEDVTWDYAPSKRDLVHGVPMPAPWNKQTQWAKTRYIEYTDSTFAARKPQPDWLGILGPVIRAEVGDDIVVEFLNRSGSSHSIHPHGLRYEKSSEGAHYIPSGPGAAVLPGKRFTYHWFADEGSGPGPADSSSVVWWYHPHTDEPTETNAGLLGPIIVTAAGKARPDGTPKDVDREFVAAYMIFDELKGQDAGQFHAINGYVFGNLPGYTAKQGDNIRWYLMAMGNEKDLHTPHWHGKTVQYGGRHTDVVELLPASMVSVDMIADNPGTWLFHCQVTDHMEAGMTATYTVYQAPKQSCPVEFTAGNFWNDAKEFSLTARNISGKTINRLVLTPGMFLSPMDLRPSPTAWLSTNPIHPGQSRELTSKNYLHSSKDILGWSFSPQVVVFADGTKWDPQVPGECFHVYWRDESHPSFPVLPPFQVEGHED